jgi:hypothetical protein
MRRLHSRFQTWLTLPALMAFCWLGTPANAQSSSAQSPGAQPPPTQSYSHAQDDDTTRQELASFNQFLDSHPELAGQLRKDPSLVNNDDFVKQHPSLQTYLQQHPQVTDELREDPNAFMRQESRFDRREDSRDRDVNREELARFDQFLDTHRETAEQLRKDPSLVNNDEFVRNHPALQSYLREHPELRAQIKQDPNAFMQQEARYDRHEDGMNRDDDFHRHSASFGEFLGGHSEISQRLSDDPSLVKNQEYMENHPELRDYLNAHPDVKQDLMANPQNFVKSAQQFSTTSSTTPAVKAPLPDPAKPRQ